MATGYHAAGPQATRSRSSARNTPRNEFLTKFANSRSPHRVSDVDPASAGPDERRSSSPTPPARGRHKFRNNILMGIVEYPVDTEGKIEALYLAVLSRPLRG